MSQGDAYGIILNYREHNIMIPVLFFKCLQTETERKFLRVFDHC